MGCLVQLVGSTLARCGVTLLHTTRVIRISTPVDEHAAGEGRGESVLFPMNTEGGTFHSHKPLRGSRPVSNRLDNISRAAECGVPDSKLSSKLIQYVENSQVASPFGAFPPAD